MRLAEAASPQAPLQCSIDRPCPEREAGSLPPAEKRGRGHSAGHGRQRPPGSLVKSLGCCPSSCDKHPRETQAWPLLLTGREEDLSLNQQKINVENVHINMPRIKRESQSLLADLHR